MPRVEVISHQVIKPSSPTPPHLHTYKLSWLDQQTAISHLPVTFFYRNHQPHTTTDEKIQTLKTSLSQTLSLYYPLAGRQNGNSLVDCNDEGVDFYVAQVNAEISEVREVQNEQAGLELESELLPCERSCGGSGDGFLLAVQVNVFGCGGVAVGVCLSHKISDGRSMASFMMAWAAAASGSDLKGGSTPHPVFDAAAALSPSESSELNHQEQRLDEKPQMVKRFPLNGSKIAALRSRTSPPPKPTTRVQAVSAVLWRCIIRAHAKSQGCAAGLKPSVVSLLVDTRPRADPPSPSHAFGNRCIMAAAGLPLETVQTVADGSAENGCEAEEEIKRSVRMVDSDYVKKLGGGEGHKMKYEMVITAARRCRAFKGIDLYIISSWVRLPVYEVDFGWGKPELVGFGTGMSRNAVVLIPARDGEGMVAWVSLEEEEMGVFERDEELVSLLVSS